MEEKKASKGKEPSHEDAVNRVIKDSLKDSDFPTLAESHQALRAERKKDLLKALVAMEGPEKIIAQLEKFVEKLKQLVPDVQLKKNTADRKVWFEGTEEELKEIAEYLEDYCIKIGEPALATKGNWVLFLSDPLYTYQIDHLPSFEYWKNKKFEDPSDMDSLKEELVRSANELEKSFPGTKWKKVQKIELSGLKGQKKKQKRFKSI